MKNNKTMVEFVNKRIAFLILLLYTLFYVALTITWLKLNLTPPSWDQSAFLLESENYYHALKEGDTDKFIDLYINPSSSANPPLISLLPVPWYIYLGDELRTQNFIFTLPIIIFVLFYFLLINDLTHSPCTALIAVILTSSMPFVAYMSRTYLIEYWQMVFTVVWLYYLTRSSYFKIQRYNILLGFILGFGLLLKITFPIYLWGPLSLFFLYRTREDRDKTIRERDIFYANILTIIVPAFLVAGTWYKNHLTEIIAYSYSAWLGALAKDYSIGTPLDPSVLFTFWKILVTNIISSYQFFLFILTLLVLVFNFIFRKKKSGILKADKNNYLFFFLWFVVPFLFVSISENKNPKYVLPFLPAIGGSLALLLTNIFGLKKYGLLIISVLLIVPITSYAYMTIPQMGVGSLTIGGINILNNDIVQANRPKNELWPIDIIIEKIEQDAQTNWPESSLKSPQVMLIVDHPQFNQNTFRYFASKKASPIIFAALLTRNESDWIIQKEKLLISNYVIIKTGYQGYNFTNHENVSITELLDSRELPFIKIFTCPLPDGSIGVIYRYNNEGLLPQRSTP